MKKILVLLLISFMFIPNIKAEEASTLAENSKSAILLEPTTGEIIYEKNIHEKLPPASMTKLMSMLLIMESIDKGVIKWDEMVTVSSNASGMGGSQILLETGEQMTVEDLFKGVAIASGNDAVVALAEKIAGTEEMFVKMMNDKVKELGLKNTNFKNPHGLDAANHYSTAYDMAMIAKELIKHEKVLEYTSIYETYLRQNLPTKIWLVNTNRLVRFYSGLDGLKTGYTGEAGYCLTFTAKNGNMRLLGVVMGEPTSDTRNEEVKEMLDYGFAQYEVETMLSTKSILDTKEVDKGKKRYVNLVPKEDINFLNKKTDGKRNASYEVKIDNLKAPLKVGDKVGTLIIKENNNTRKVDITVSENIEKANILELFIRHLEDIITGNIKF
ncbi:MAG: D-alanyl-D-alanine carboxypeptidase [Firmicutes bacterium]|nr:D-alanyl-D-alanine carboxypeptidase [Bacillota bacterium]